MSDRTERALDEAAIAGLVESQRRAGAGNQGLRQRLRSGEPIGEITLASYSAEQTAEFLSGRPLGEPTIHDADLKAALAREDAQLRRVLLEVVVPHLAGVLTQDSPLTADRLTVLSEGCRDGNPDTSRLLGVLVGQLLTRGLHP
jgi:hypothetical protein